MTRIIGLIAGSGQLPYDVIKYCTDSNVTILPIFIDNDNIQTQLIAQKLSSQPYAVYKIGQVGKAIDYFTAHQVSEVVFIGAIERPNFTSLKVDYLGAKLVAKILKNKLLGDDTVLRIIAEFFNDYGFTVTNAQSLFSGKITYEAGVIVAPHHPFDINSIFAEDIRIGLKAARLIGELDIGQAVIVENKYILSIEAAEGTDNLIIRSQALQKLQKQAILVKIMKPNQDARFDVPTIGCQTIEYAAAHGLAGIVIEANKVFIVDAEKVIERAKALDIFLIAVN